MLTNASFSNIDFRGLNDIVYKAKDINIASKSLAELSRERNLMGERF